MHFNNKIKEPNIILTKNPPPNPGTSVPLIFYRFLHHVQVPFVAAFKEAITPAVEPTVGCTVVSAVCNPLRAAVISTNHPTLGRPFCSTFLSTFCAAFVPPNLPTN